MAEHIRHALSRSGFPVRPSRIGTLAQWLDSWNVPKAPPPALLHFLIVEALDRLKPERFAPVSHSKGFHAAVSELLNEIPREAFSKSVLPDDVASLLRTVCESLAARGFASRNERLRDAAKKIRTGANALPEQVIVDGFITLAPAELDFVEALAARTAVTITLPEFEGADLAGKRRLEAAGFAREYFPKPRRSPNCTAFSAASPEREAEQIARQILVHSAHGRQFREIGIVLRARDPYGPLLETTLARFGIPTRSYFTDPLTMHPAIAYLSGIVNALLNGWDHTSLAALLRMPVSGFGATPAGDRFDFAFREKLPGKGLPLAGVSDTPAILETLAGFDRWCHDRMEPADWAVRLRMLRRLLPPPTPREHADRDEIYLWRSTAAALEAFDQALEQTSESLAGMKRIGLDKFWKQTEMALALEPLRVEDRRRNVVHIMDVFEARQWELRVVFLCGLLERDFPQYHREDPVIGDALRRRLDLLTAAQRQQEERFLFDLALTRATDETILSYARFNEKGEETLPSFFLTGVEAPPCVESRVCPAPSRTVPMVAEGHIQDSALLAQLGQAHRTLSPSGIESFLQCPFQFFARKTLRLRERPPAPRDRLNLLLKGSILHRALAEWIAAPLLGTAIFNRVFEDECARAGVPRTYRTEAARLELLRHFEGFLEDRQLELPWTTRTEEKFRFPLNGLVTIQGRIDRLDIGPDREALVIDYKYSAGNKIRERVEQSETGNLVQGGLYLLAAERAFELKPVGMLYCGLKKEVSWGGWHVSIAGLERVGESRTREALRELMDEARRRAAEVYEAIASGRIAALPADPRKCRWCDYQDVCRVETAAFERGTGAA